MIMDQTLSKTKYEETVLCGKYPQMSAEHIQTPMPGIYYTRPDPDEDAYVEEGDQVSEGDVVGLVGVMKNFHDITAPVDGTITDVIAENEQEIDAGDELLVLDPS